MPFKADGYVDADKARALNLYVPSERMVKQLPVLSKEDKDYKTICDAITELEILTTPAKDHEILFELKKLSTHYLMQKKSNEDFQMQLNDHLDDLENYPIDLIREACRRVRTEQDDKKYDIFPRPGKLLAIISHELFVRKRKLKRLKMLKQIADNPPPPPEPMPEKKDVSGLAKSLGNTLNTQKKLTPQEQQAEHERKVKKTVDEMVATNMLTPEQAEEAMAGLKNNHSVNIK